MPDSTNKVSENTGIRSYEEYQQTRAVKSELGKDDFLALLAAQLQYQNPLEPQSDTQFISQLAQFSSLSYMQTMSQAMTSQQFLNLVGKHVYADVTMEDGTKASIQGIVDRVIMQDGVAFAQVGEYIIDCTKISQVIDNELFAGNNSLLSNANLIGKYLQAYVPTADGKTAVAAGLCTRISVTNGALVAHLDSGVMVGLADIFDISDAPTAVTEIPEELVDNEPAEAPSGETSEDTQGNIDMEENAP